VKLELLLPLAVAAVAPAVNPSFSLLLIVRGVLPNMMVTSRFVCGVPMTARYFTVDEANELLVELKPLMAELLERRARVVMNRNSVIDMLKRDRSDIGGKAASALVVEFIAIERLAKKIRSYGCVLRDINKGLLDFLALRDGREVYLCWRYGEPQIVFYHELHTGFQGREPV
jgi:hypothetical protein